MVWLWLLFPVVVLGAALTLWRASTRLREHHQALRDEVDRLTPLTDGPAATGREPGHR